MIVAPRLHKWDVKLKLNMSVLKASTWKPECSKYIVQMYSVVVKGMGPWKRQNRHLVYTILGGTCTGGGVANSRGIEKNANMSAFSNNQV